MTYFSDQDELKKTIASLALLLAEDLVQSYNNVRLVENEKLNALKKNGDYHYQIEYWALPMRLEIKTICLTDCMRFLTPLLVSYPSQAEQIEKTMLFLKDEPIPIWSGLKKPLLSDQREKINDFLKRRNEQVKIWNNSTRGSSDEKGAAKNIANQAEVLISVLGQNEIKEEEILKEVSQFLRNLTNKTRDIFLVMENQFALEFESAGFNSADRAPQGNSEENKASFVRLVDVVKSQHQDRGEETGPTPQHVHIKAKTP